MPLASPELLWLLPPLALLLWWTSRPPRPRRHVYTAHFEQWQSALLSLRRRPPRGSWLRLLLLFGAAVAVCLAAAGPRTQAVDGPRRLVCVLDGSASMAAVDADGVSAFERARAAMHAVFTELPADVDVTVLQCGAEPLRRAGESARALQDLRPPGGTLGVDLGQLVAALGDEPATAVWLLTDGQGQSALPEVGALSVCDASGPNAAIVDVRIDDHWPLPELEVEVDVVAFGGAAGSDGLAVDVQVAGAVDQPTRRALRLEPTERRTLTFGMRRIAAGGELAVSVQLAGDVLAQDDRRAFVLPPLPAPRIAALAEGDEVHYVDAAAEALAEEVSGAVVAATADGASTEPISLLLVDGGVLAMAAGSARVLAFGTRFDGDQAPGEAVPGDDARIEPWPDPGPIDWSRSSPLVAGLDLSELRVARAWRGVLPAGGEPFLWTMHGGRSEPLGVIVPGAGGRGDVASVHFAFRLQDANLPVLAAFPQLLRRAFVLGHGRAAAIEPVAWTSVPASERNLGAAARAPDRPLPAFQRDGAPLSRWFVLAGLLLLAVRGVCR